MKNIKSSKLNHVTLSRRFGAMLYDFFLLIGMLIIASAIVVIPFKLTPDKPTFIFYQLYIFTITYIFYIWFWTHSGQTLGMQTWKFKITTTKGEPVNLSQATIRYFVAIISITVFGLGFFWSIVDKKNRTWHDIASRTKLIRI